MNLGHIYGHLKWKLTQRWRHGWRVAYWRDIARRRILSTPPIRGLNDRSIEAHVLTSAGDWLNLVWVLKSFYQASGRRYSLCIHEDGSLSPRQLDTLRRHFPDARVIDRPTADRLVRPTLKDFPRSAQFREHTPLALKVLDFAALLESPRMLLLDSDILFFHEPTELLRRLEDPTYKVNTLNQDWNYGYSVMMEQVRPMLNFEFPERINSGLGLIHRGSIPPEWVEGFLALPDILSHNHRIEQTLIALCSAKFGYEMLPPEYDVHVGSENPGIPCRHYTGPIRHLMYSGGIRRLVRNGTMPQISTQGTVHNTLVNRTNN